MNSLTVVELSLVNPVKSTLKLCEVYPVEMVDGVTVPTTEVAVATGMVMVCGFELTPLASVAVT